MVAFQSVDGGRMERGLWRDLNGGRCKMAFKKVWFFYCAIILVNNGSDGSCYVCLSCYDGEYVTGIYDEYHPQTAAVNGKEVRKKMNIF